MHKYIQDGRCDLGDGGLGMVLVQHAGSRADKRRAADCKETKVSENIRRIIQQRMQYEPRRLECVDESGTRRRKAGSLRSDSD